MKRINKECKDSFRILSQRIWVLKLRFLAFPGGPRGFRELREAYRNHFRLCWYLIVPGVTSYGLKPWGGLIRPGTVAKHNKADSIVARHSKANDSQTQQNTIKFSMEK